MRRTFAVLLAALAFPAPAQVAPTVDERLRRLEALAADVFGNSGATFYVKSDTGSDSDTCRSWAHACKTILAAYDKAAESGAAIYLANGSQVGGEVAGQGIWLGNAERGRGWRPQKPVRFVGAAPGASGTYRRAGQSKIVPSSGSWQRGQPAIWLVGGSPGLSFENIAIDYPWVGIRLGVTSSGDRNPSNYTALVWFENCSVIMPHEASDSGKGPAVDVGWAFWIWFTNCTIGAYDGVETTHDRRAAVLVDGRGGTNTGSSGLIYVRDGRFSQGGIKYYVGSSSWSLYVSDLLVEGDFSNPVGIPVHIVGSTTYGQARLESIGTADAPGTEADVKIEGSGPPDSVVVRDVAKVVGPVTRIGGYAGALYAEKTSPLRRGQQGFFRGALIGQTDAGRRLFGPSVARYANLVSAAPMAESGNAVVISNRPSPSGVALAYRFATGDSKQAHVSLYNAHRKVAAGDYIIAGAWYRLPGGPASTPAAILFAPVGGSGYTAPTWKYTGDGEWEWITMVARVATAGTQLIRWEIPPQRGHPVEVYGATLIHVPASEASENEAYEIANALASYSSSIPVGAVGLLPGQDIYLPRRALFGGTTFANLGTPGDGAMTYCSDCTVANPCARQGTGAFAKRLNGVWVCN